jgi:hypothetical protein
MIGVEDGKIVKLISLNHGYTDETKWRKGFQRKDNQDKMAGLMCRRCGSEILVYADDAPKVFEGMHWICFHMEFEHQGDPDEACSDFSCPNLKIKIYEAKLRKLGVDPKNVIEDEIKMHIK